MYKNVAQSISLFFQLSGVFVCQVQKIRNVSAPKANEESKNSPRLLKITFSDGSQVCQAIENTKLNAIRYSICFKVVLKNKTDFCPLIVVDYFYHYSLLIVDYKLLKVASGLKL